MKGRAQLAAAKKMRLRKIAQKCDVCGIKLIARSQS